MHPPTLLTVAAGGEHPLIDIDSTAFIQFGLFLLLMLVATRWLFRPYLEMRKQREEGIEGARQEAAEMISEADTRLADYEAKLAAARARAHEEQRKIRAEAAAHQREVTEKARADAAESLTAARSKLDDEVRDARDDLIPKADALADQIVVKLLGREVA